MRELKKMNTRLTMMFMILVLALGVLGFVQANGASAAMMNHTYRGDVVSYDRTANMLTVQGKYGERTFDISNAETSGVINRNERVLVKYSEANGQMVASSVEVIRPHAEMGATEPGTRNQRDWGAGYGPSTGPEGGYGGGWGSGSPG